VLILHLAAEFLSTILFMVVKTRTCSIFNILLTFFKNFITDSFSYFEKYVDPSFEASATHAKLLGLILMKIADDVKKAFGVHHVCADFFIFLDHTAIRLCGVWTCNECATRSCTKSSAAAQLYFARTIDFQFCFGT
jgi:hypothetical protein